MPPLVAACLIALVLGAPSEPVTLFDGATLDGWVQRGGPARYTVVEATIVGEAVPRSRNTFLCTERSYGDFVLELDVNVDPGLNSGVQIRSEAEATPGGERVFGYQVEVDPSDRAWSGGLYDEGRRGWLRDLSENEPARRAFRVGEWNHFRVEAIGDRLRTWVNGIPAADLIDAATLTGFIGLQVHGVGELAEPKRVRWRNLNLRELGRSRWEPLLDGRTLEGWTQTGAAFTVEGGVVIGTRSNDTPSPGLLRLERPLADATVRVEFRTTGRSSGMHLGDRPVGRFDPKDDGPFRAGEWNTMIVHRHDARVVTHLNGVRLREEVVVDHDRHERISFRLESGDVELELRSVERMVSVRLF